MTFPFPPITNPITFRASAALPAAGAWDAAPLEISCPMHGRMTLFLSYTRGAAGGAFDFQLQASPYSAATAGGGKRVYETGVCWGGPWGGGGGGARGATG